MSTSTQNPALGFFLSLIAAAMWGMLPVALKELLSGMDAITIVWYRFIVAAAVLLPWLAFKQQLPNLIAVGWRIRWYLVIAAVGLSCNYYLFNYSLNFINGETTEAVIQMTTLFLILGGVVFYKEPFIGVQKLGTLLIIAGLALFFNERLVDMTSLENMETIGVLIVFVSAVAWTVYALLQKKLLETFSSVQILFFIYSFSFLVLLPFITPGSALQLTPFQMALLGFCCLNTVVAYGCFAEALNLWDASKVSAVLALAPLFTISSLKLTVYFYPAYEFSDRLSLLSIIGALLLVAGSVLTALMPVIYQRSRERAASARVTAN
ncbi:MAG TPA: EamA family transporter [Gammaproteobacteria bacterium]|nr:DMT family transporter [Gammaproteobacteria bacterium]MDP6733250.1 DMT family transporter [Gammaproteobacteria bacterium]HAJ75788.1 EamA family transporter [Gammaproteobacteria bacterium]